MSTISRLALLIFMVLLAACATDDGLNRPTDRNKAAAIQAELASRYLQVGRLDLARDRINQALALGPRLPSTHTVAAVLQEKIGNKEGAETHYAKAVKLPGSGGAERNNYGQFLCSSERFEEAEEQFDAAIKDAFYANVETAALNAGICASRAGHLDRAERFLRSALERRPNMAEGLLSMASVQQALGNHMGARAFLQRFDATGQQSSESLALGYRIETALRDPKAAALYRQRLLDEFPNSEQAKVLKE